MEHVKSIERTLILKALNGILTSKTSPNRFFFLFPVSFRRRGARSIFHSIRWYSNNKLKFAGPLAQGRVKITSICFLVDWLYPPYPPSRQLDPKFCLLGRGPTASRPLVTAFFMFLRASWNLPRHQSFLWSILPRKNFEN